MTQYMIEYEQKRYDEADAVNPTKLLEEAKEEHTEDRGRYAYMVAFMRLEAKFREAMWSYRSVMRELKIKSNELDLLQWSAEKVLDKSEIKLGDRETVYEYLYAGAEVVRDLLERGWDDDKLRNHKITELEVEHARHLTAKDFCLNCGDPDEVLEDKDFCAYCEDELVEIVV